MMKDERTKSSKSKNEKFSIKFEILAIDYYLLLLFDECGYIINLN